MRIVVVGAGVGGLALARGLSAHGHEVSVHERSGELRRGGAGISLYPNGSAALEALGVDVSAVGRRLDAMSVRTPEGRERSTVDLAALSANLGHACRQVPRRDLLETLAAGLGEKIVRFGQACASVTATPSGPVAAFADGESVRADVVVGADGVRSVVRRELWGGSDVRETGWASWLALTPLPTALADGGAAFVAQAPGRMCSAIPAGDGLVQWWFDLPWGPGVPVLDSPVAEFRARFGDWTDPDVQAIVEHARDEDIAPFPHVRGGVRRGWGRGPVTLLGDAAHPFPPSTGQGANQTLEDVWALTLALSGPRADADPAAALRRYEHARYQRVALASIASGLEVVQQHPMPPMPRGIADRLVTGQFISYIRSVSTVLAAERAGVGLP